MLVPTSANRCGAARSSRSAIPVMESSRRVSAMVTAPNDHAVFMIGAYTSGEHSSGGTNTVSIPPMTLGAPDIPIPCLSICVCT